MAPAGHDSMRSEAAANGYDANRAAMDPNYRIQTQQYAHSPAQSHGTPDSRPQTRNRPPTRMEGASPVIYQFEVCVSVRSLPIGVHHGVYPLFPLCIGVAE